MEQLTQLKERQANHARSTLDEGVTHQELIVTTTDFSSDKTISASREIAIELEYSTSCFTIEPGVQLRTVRPIMLGYENDSDSLHVLGWNLEVPLGEGSKIPKLIARRFLELFSKSQNSLLSNDEASVFAQICSQVDYREFCALRRPPFWNEALIRKTNPYTLDLGDSNLQKLDKKTAAALSLFKENDYIGAWFKCARDGKIQEIKGAILLPNPASDDEELDWPTPKPLEFDEALNEMLPDFTSWESADES